MAIEVRPSDFLRQVITETGISQSDAEVQDGRDDSVLALMKLSETRPQVEKHHCLFCYAEFTIALDLHKHTRKFHSVYRDHECIDCGRLFKNEKAMSVHIATVHRKAFPCQVCGARFGTKLARDRHILVHADEKPYGCQFCVKTFRSKAQLEDHARTHTGEKAYSCYVCNENFGGVGELSMHMVREHQNARLFQCDICDRMFQSGKRFMRHRRDHEAANQHGDKAVKCAFCPVYFTDLQQIEHHIKQVHPPNSKPTRTPVTVSHVTNYNCSECQYYYETYEDLSIHLESLHFLFQCRYCYLQYTSKQALKAHVRQSHGSFYALSCHICDRNFTDQGSLNRHIAMHDQFTCPHCDASFQDESKLKHHQKVVHNPETMEKCNICRQQFATKNRLQRHLQCHLPPALHKCKVCHAGFNQEKMVERHMQVVHLKSKQEDTGPTVTYQIVQDGATISVVMVGGANTHDLINMLCSEMEEVFICNICNTEFVEKEDLLAHINDHDLPELILALVEQERARATIAGAPIPKEIVVTKTSCQEKESDSEDDLEDRQHEAFMRNRPKSAPTVVLKRYTSTRCCFCDKLLASEHDLQVHEKMHINNYDFRCTACNEEFVDGDDLIKHRRMHKKRLRRSYQCAHCGIIMNDANLMKQHIDTHSGFALEDEQLMINSKPEKKSRENKFSCHECRLWFQDGRSYRKHVGTHLDGKPHRCHTCGRGYAKMSTLKYHQKTHQAVAPLGCNHCSERFDRTYRLNKHLIVAHNVGQFGCRKCDLRFHSKEIRAKHEKKHKSKDQYNCALCDAVFVTVDAFKRHVFTHENKQPLKKKQDQQHRNIQDETQTHWCVICQATFDREEDLLAHGTKHFKCDLCATEFADAMELECHTLDHAALARNICLNCGDTFKDQEYLWEHTLEMHNDSQACRCEKCHCVLLSHRHSQIHMLTHPLEEEADYHCDYFCNMCQMIFTTESFLNIHNERHKPCQICNELPEDLTLHLLQNHSLPQVEKCYHCDRVLTDPVTRAEHLNTHAVSPEVLERCGECEAGFTDMETLDEHNRNAHNHPACKCIICGMLCLGKEGLIQHLTSEHMVYSVQRCAQCPLIFLNTSAEDMEKHLLTHKPKVEMSCCACGIKFADKKLLKAHIVQTHGETIKNLYGCAECTQKFSNNKDLRIHTRVVHGSIGDSEKGKFVCGICSRKVVLSKCFEHVGKHLKDKPYSCVLCPLSFTTQASMDRHFLLHGNDFPGVCQICGEGFLNAERLKAHERTHQEEKSYVCRVTGCNEKFPLASKLKNHGIRKHGLTAPFRCGVCEQKFVYKDQLHDHMVRHGGGRKFRCYTCKMLFRSYDGLSRHLRKAHNEQPFQCGQCQAVLSAETRDSHFCSGADQVTQVVSMETDDQLPGADAVAMGSDPVAIAMSQISTNQDGDGFVYIAMDEGGECCPICMAQFSNQDELRYHMLLHQDVNGLPS